MTTLKARLFHRFRLMYDERDLASLMSIKGQELLCYLLLYRNRPHRREYLATLLWSNSGAAQSRKNLRKTLWQLQAMLNSEAASAQEPLLLHEPDWIRINPKADVWIDVAILEQAFTDTHGLLGQKLEVQAVQMILNAINEYQGDLLEGMFQDWCLLERERLQGIYLTLLDKLMSNSEAHDDFETGIIFGSRALQYDRARERTHRLLMRLYYLAGDRTGALRQFDRCVEALAEELGVKPSKRTLSLFHRIQSDHFEEHQPSSSAYLNASTERRLSLTAENQKPMEHLRDVLAEMQSQLAQALKTVDQTLKSGEELNRTSKRK